MIDEDISPKTILELLILVQRVTIKKYGRR